MIAKKIYFDTAIFIYALECNSEEARNLFQQAISEGIAGTSTITIMEYATGCYKHEAKEEFQRFFSFLRDYKFEITAINEEVSLEAARIRSQYPNFKQMDALQIASAVIAGADVFCTNDKQLLQYGKNENERLRIISLHS